jgi:hypothetical protein
MPPEPPTEPLFHSLDGFGGYLRCESCGAAQSLGDVAGYLRDGWPRHCGYTMRWWTARQVAAGEDMADG